MHILQTLHITLLPMRMVASLESLGRYLTLAHHGNTVSVVTTDAHSKGLRSERYCMKEKNDVHIYTAPISAIVWLSSNNCIYQY